MQAEGIIAALIGAAAGGGGLRVLSALRPQKESEVVTYYRDVLTSVMKENKDQRKRIRTMLEEAERTYHRIEHLEEAVEKIERGELPPEYS